MALSFGSNLGSFQQQNHQEIETYPQLHTEIAAATELLGCHDNFAMADTFINPLYDFDEQLFYSDSYTNLLPYFTSPTDNIPELSPVEEFESYQHCPKRQKSYADNSCLTFEPSFFDGCVANANPIPDLLPELSALVPKFEFPMGFSVGRTENVMKKPSGASLSAQSIAARERRRKITEKTQELGKLIPGGNRMNTAEMFQAASKYVKFMQVQVSILELMGSSFQEKMEPPETQELQIILASPTMQEKLYSQEKCLVPREFVQAMAKSQDIPSNCLIHEEIEQLLGNSG